MSAVAIKGWCPGAWRPMQSGDGFVARIKPHDGRIDAEQAAGIADLAEQYGNGLIDLTNRANLQIRGVSEEGLPSLIDGLAKLRLLDPDPDIEARRNILVAPFWTPGDEVISIAEELERALAAGPVGLPAKFGFAIDCGSERVLAGSSADVRIERDVDRQLIVRADGAELGRRVTRGDAASVAHDLAKWFVASGGVAEGRGRMAAHIKAGAQLPEALNGDALPARQQATPKLGLTPHGALFGVAFGQITHTTLRWLAAHASGLRLTPWRMLLAEGLREMPACDGLIIDGDDPLLRVVACSGAPRCPEAHADTRALAGALAPHLAADTRLHVSGCAKGCAQSGPASITLVATAEGFDLVRNGSTRDAPARRGLLEASIVASPSVLLGGR
ncbi:precorrin-3B synthase [Bradyrhizobium sp.]|uniref:precorrin-3B synthase n=1 Tax=Bradyrhizobium sp. TaxID=376 RepID=UPI002D53C238|nr:precorrin-3B synthase [Bradyrhizobium sp.]HZR71723.1 precorrin-3B synthase [Bradyrhizobium sp.]